MPKYDYKVVPAPAQGVKAKGVKAPEDRFALALAQLMNALAEEGWEYQRAETLPCTEGGGFFSRASTTVYRSMLVFRRPLAAPEAAVVAPVAEMAEPVVGPVVGPVAAPVAGPVVEAPQVARSDARADVRPDPRPDPRVAIAAATAAQAQGQSRTQVQPQAEAPAQEPPVRRRLMAAFAAPEAPAAPSPVLRAEREEPARGGRRLNLATPMVPRSASTTAGTGPRPVLRFPGESRDGTQRGE